MPTASMSLWQTDFNSALSEYLTLHGIDVGHDPAAIHRGIQDMTGSTRRGIWRHVGQRLGVESTMVRNYYHNTWVRQFFAPIGNFVKELDKLVHVHQDMTPAALAAAFQASHPGEEFCERYIQQLLFSKLRRQKQMSAVSKPKKQPRRPPVLKTEESDTEPKAVRELEPEKYQEQLPYLDLDFLLC